MRGSEAADKKLEDYLKRLDAGDAKRLCQHGGLCISSDAVKFDEPCTYMPGQG